MNINILTVIILGCCLSVSASPFVNSTEFHKIEINVLSSENGYTLCPDNILIQHYENPKITNYLISRTNNRYSANLPSGTYLLTISKEGYTSCMTYFLIEQNDIRYNVYLDALNKDPMLSNERIKQLLKDNYCLLLGYIVNDETGLPLSGVTVKQKNSDISTKSNSSGYFEFYLPATCDIRNFSWIQFMKPGYHNDEYKDFELFPKTDFVFTVRMKPENYSNLPSSDLLKTKNDLSNCTDCNQNKVLSGPLATGFVLPVNIRVGRNCTGTNCTYAEVYTVETYCKYVLPAEIYACWGNLNGGMNSLQACAVAVRTYGIYYVYNPINPSLYDICDNTYCQYMGNVTSTNTNNAVDNTYRNILTNSSGVVRCEYSAENNNKGCGNGYSGTGTSWPCIYDPVCLNRTPNGHGRGLCQWGTIRWATGTLVSTSSPCNLGTAHSYGIKNWQQILTHYYNVSPFNWTVTLGTTATINSSVCSPSSTNPCSTITITSNVNVTNPTSLMIGASIAPAGTTNWISDPAHDVKVVFNQGTSNYNRLFTVPCQTQSGSYDLLTAIWYDKDNNNQINTGDFVVHSKHTANALTISPTGVITINNNVPVRNQLFQNYPNPFNPVTNIQFSIKNIQHVTLKVYDILGHELATLVNRQIKPGTYEVEFTGEYHPSGIYYYKIVTEDFTDTKKMLLVK